MSMTISHRWLLQVQQGEGEWRTTVDCPSPVTKQEFARYQEMNMFAGHNFRVIHRVVTTTTQLTRVEPVDPPVPVAS